MNPRAVILSAFEQLRAATIGVSRTVGSIELGRQLERGRIGHAWYEDCIGAIGEYAYALANGRLWRPLIGAQLDTRYGDVDGVQVRTTERRNGCLIIRPQDDPSHEFALVVLDLPKAHVFEPIPGRVGKVERFWRDVDYSRGVHAAAFFVPQNEVLASAQEALF